MAIVSERIAGGLTFAQNFYNAGQIGIQMYCKYGIMGESLGLDTAGEVLGLGLSTMGYYSGLYSMGHISNRLLALQGQAEAGLLCFVAGTKVKTPDGDQNIEDIEVGDEVWSCDAETGETGSKHVTRLSVNEARDIAHVTIDGETIDATTTHPFYVEGYGFKPAGELAVGDKALLLNGETKEIEDVTLEHLDEPVRVYNFEVEDWHTYYVAELGVLVHNMCAVVAKGGSNTINPQLINSQSELSKEYFDTLQSNGTLKSGGRSGESLPQTAPANSYYITEGGHVVIYGEDGRRVMDISSERIKIEKFNQNPNNPNKGKWSRRKLEDSNGMTDKTAQWILDYFGIK